MFINIKNLTGSIDIVEIGEYDPVWKLQVIYSSQSNIPFDQLKFITGGISLLRFKTFFKSLKDLGIVEGTTIHVLLRLGGPQPEERAVFNYFGKQAKGLETPSFETLEKLFEKKDRIDIVCPVCLTFQVVRVLSCGEHLICTECFDSLPMKRCPMCDKFPVKIL